MQEDEERSGLLMKRNYNIYILQIYFAYKIVLFQKRSQGWYSFHLEMMALYKLVQLIAVQDRLAFGFFLYREKIGKVVLALNWGTLYNPADINLSTAWSTASRSSSDADFIGLYLHFRGVEFHCIWYPSCITANGQEWWVMDFQYWLKDWSRSPGNIPSSGIL